jgi:hypothetical protein
MPLAVGAGGGRHMILSMFKNANYLVSMKKNK